MARGKTDDSRAAIRCSSEWGIPDWRDVEAYGDVRRWTFFHWRWEFLRRRDDLRSAFVQVDEQDKQFFGEDDDRYKDRPCRGTPGHFVFISRKKQAHECLGYHGRLPDPSVSNHPEELLESPPPGFMEDYWMDGFFPNDTMELVWELLREHKIEDAGLLEGVLAGRQTVPMPAGPYRAIISFDLTKPLKEQLSRATHFLNRAQIEKVGKVVPTKRRHPKKWLSYLRTLDARESGTSWAEIATLHPDTAQRQQTARDIWEAADALRFNF